MQQNDNPSPTATYYVSPEGNDRWSGRLPAPAEGGKDGPFATITRARDAVRELKRNGLLTGPVTVWLRGGRYPLRAPITFGPDDTAPVTYSAYPGETPIVDGGERITGFRVERIGGREAWVTKLPEVERGAWYFRSLFVNGARRPRARFPKVGSEPERRRFHVMEDVPGTAKQAGLFDGTWSFVAAPGDFDATWRNITDIDIVALHYWVEERMPVESFNPATRLVTSSRRSIFALKDDSAGTWARYYVENVFEALTEPGEWYLDGPTGTLSYLPMPGESPETVEIYAPRTDELLVLAGKPAEEKYLEFIRFVGITFENADWHQPVGGHDPDTGSTPGIEYAASPQAAAGLGGAISLEGTLFCAIEECTIRHVGLYGVDVRSGCRGNRIVGNEMTDCGGGGVKMSGADAHGRESMQTGNNRVTDNHIHSCGRIFHSATGIILRHAFGNVVAHNHIHDLYYSGVSCGWVWGYGPNVSRGNIIEKNHIHDLGHGWLSDMGGIYTLGIQPGTVIRGNLIHGVTRANYGGWAIYPDEGSSHIVIEGNVCYDTNSQPFHQHYGEENVVRNNLFAFGREAQVALSRVDKRIGFTFERNIVITEGQPVFTGGYAHDPSKPGMISDLNLFWDVAGALEPAKETSFEAWRKHGHDIHSLVADPKCADIGNRDFALAADSPAFGLGFKAINLSDVGPRKREDRE
jgi:hypothetical protein